MPTAAQRAARTFHAHRAALLALLAQIPEDQAGHTPWDGAMTFISLGDHLDASCNGLLSALNGQAPSREVSASRSLEEARSRLQESGEQVKQALSGLSDEQLAHEVPGFGGRSMPLAQLADLMIQHEAHHKGQVWLMARQVGVKPPFFMQM